MIRLTFLTAKKLSNDGLKDIYVSNESLIWESFLHKDIKVIVMKKMESFKIGTELK